MEFPSAVEIILEKEGGYVWDERDPGGETNFGISKAAYPQIDIENLTLGHAKLIYENDYWNACKCSGLPEEIRLIVFDCAVNQGVFVAGYILQSIIQSDHRTIKQDGQIGPKTLAAVKTYSYNHGARNLLLTYAKKRILRYSKLRTYKHFGRGWVNRVFDILQESEL